MRLSKRSEYGLKASVYLAKRFGAGYVQSKEVAQAERLPGKFLESILLSLRSASILESKVGAGGGYRLARTPDRILVLDLINALEPAEAIVPAVSFGADIPGDGDFVETTGRHALSMLHERMEGALETAIGTLTLSDVLEQADHRSQNKRSVMYYI